MLVLVALIGGVAASISASRAIVQQERLRRSMQGLLVSELLLRTVLGSMSAGFIYLMVSSGAITFGSATAPSFATIALNPVLQGGQCL